MRAAGVVLVSAVLAGGCLQKLDTHASSATAVARVAPGPTVALDTPPIELPVEGETTTDPCVVTTLQASDILRGFCAGCHGGGSPGARQGQPPFDYVLDVERLKQAVSAVPDPQDRNKGMRFVLPGEPERSRLYLRVARGEMPPVPPLGLDPIPLPSFSDVSVLREWIASCLGVKGAPVVVPVVDAGID